MPVILDNSADFWDLAKDILKSGHSMRFRARGWSMGPLIHSEDVLTVKPLDPIETRAGDVVFYRHTNGRVLVHRVARRMEGNGKVRFLIQGDAFDNPDGSVSPEQILGKVVLVERKDAPKQTPSIWIQGMFYRLLTWLWRMPSIRSSYRWLR